MRATPALRLQATRALRLQATKPLRGGQHPDPKNGVYDPLAGIVKNAVFNTYRRTKHQILYWLPPLVLAYFLMDWAVEQLVADLEEEYHLWELRD
ncbi:ubiquinol--cytochrome-c reductase subunit 8 [Exophiala dermatitidis]|nr:ubiquinol--cytochrome-c reductase subunit 8 [Exophiala dermatitidis]